MMLRIRRLTATVGDVALATAASVALSAAPGGASPQPAAAPGTKYAASASGLEVSVSGNGDYARIVNRRTVAVSFKTSSSVDEVRVITRATTSESTALKGYRMLAADGGVFDFGGQQFYGST